MDKGILPVITLYQPWATWILRGWKLIETRIHNRFRCLNGKVILIHAGQQTDAEAANNPYLTRQQILYKPDEIVNSAIIGRALVSDFRILDENDSSKALIDCASTLRYGLFLNEVMTFENPIKVGGERGIWYFNLDTMAKSTQKQYQLQSQNLLNL